MWLLERRQVDVHFASSRYCSWCEHFCASRKVVDVRHSTGMHQLHENLSALGMNGIGHVTPSSNVRNVEKTCAKTDLFLEIILWRYFYLEFWHSRVR